MLASVKDMISSSFSSPFGFMHNTVKKCGVMLFIYIFFKYEGLIDPNF